jgi:hypothetical protein
MSQKEIQEILSKVIDLPLSEITSLQLAQKRILEQRSEAFIAAIKTSDIDKIKELIKLEINFEDGKLWSKLYDFSISNINEETFNFLLKLDLQVKPIPDSLINGYLNCRKDLNIQKDTYVNPIVVLKYFIKAGLENTIKHYKFSDQVFEIAKNHIEPHKFPELAKHAITRLASFDNLDTYVNTHRYIQSNPNELIPILFNNIQKEENLNAFLNNKIYKEYLENNIKVNANVNLMNQAVNDAVYSKITMLHNKGVDFPSEKAPYSGLFQKIVLEAFDSQKYVINHIPDITFGNQIILRTLLHKPSFEISVNKDERLEKKLELIQSVLSRYSPEQLDLLPIVLKKREPCVEVNLVKKHFDYYQFKKQIENSHDNRNGAEIKKLKI